MPTTPGPMLAARLINCGGESRDVGFVVLRRNSVVVGIAAFVLVLVALLLKL